MYLKDLLALSLNIILLMESSKSHTRKTIGSYVSQKSLLSRANKKKTESSTENITPKQHSRASTLDIIKKLANKK